MFGDRMIRVWVMVFVFGSLLGLCGQADAVVAGEGVGLRFWGRVVDQNDEVVAGAVVHAFVYDSLQNKAQPAHKITASTDTGGTFELSAAGVRLGILSIKKQGCEFGNPHLGRASGSGRFCRG